MGQAKYFLRFFFDAGSGICLWSGNEVANARFGYVVTLADLPLSTDIVAEGERLIALYDQSIDWSYPLNPTVWGSVQINAFSEMVNGYVTQLQEQLGAEYAIKNEYMPPISAEAANQKPYPEYSVVRIVQLLTSNRAFDGSQGVMRPPRMGDVGTIVQVFEPIKQGEQVYIVENVASTGETIWLADFQHEELEMAA